MLYIVTGYRGKSSEIFTRIGVILHMLGTCISFCCFSTNFLLTSHTELATLILQYPFVIGELGYLVLPFCRGQIEIGYPALLRSSSQSSQRPIKLFYSTNVHLRKTLFNSLHFFPQNFTKFKA